MEQNFSKYERSGAYHWRQTSNSLKHYNAWLAGRYTKVLELTANLKPQNILDIGCGDGYLTARIARQFPASKVIGIDSSEIAIKMALEKTAGINNLTFITESYENFLFKNSFDLIICADVIEHLENYKGLIRNCFDLLEYNGYLILTTPIRIYKSPKDPFHVQEFSPEEIRNLLHQEGFVVIEHHLSHPSTIKKRYDQIFSPLGIGRIRLYKYAINFLSIFFDKNPFVQLKSRHHSILEMQSILSKKKSR